jgi:predicted nucleic-acid-binding protein
MHAIDTNVLVRLLTGDDASLALSPADGGEGTGRI